MWVYLRESMGNTQSQPSFPSCQRNSRRKGTLRRAGMCAALTCRACQAGSCVRWISFQLCLLHDSTAWSGFVRGTELFPRRPLEELLLEGASLKDTPSGVREGRRASVSCLLERVIRTLNGRGEAFLSIRELWSLSMKDFDNSASPRISI